MENIWEYKRYVPFLGILYCQSLVWGVAGEYCSKFENGQTRYIQCDYGCCGSSTDRSCCTISSAVLIVACVISGLVVVALLAAIAVCCYKKYKDKQNSRIREMRQQQADQTVIRRNVQPPKPPTYVNAPPAYSETMPDSHYRPVTVTGRTTPSNQRFTGRRQMITQHGNASTRNSDMFSRHFVAVTQTSGTTAPPANTFQTNNNVTGSGAGLPGSTAVTPPPAYSEFARGQTPAHRRQPVNMQPTLPEESETPSDMAPPYTATTRPQARASSGISRLPVPVQTPVSRQRGSGPSSRNTTSNLHGTPSDSGLETLTIV